MINYVSETKWWWWSMIVIIKGRSSIDHRSSWWSRSSISMIVIPWSLGHAEQLLFSGLCSKLSISNYVTCDMSHFACHMSHYACQTSYVKCLSWSSGHSEQILFSCVCSKVSICNYVTCHMSHVLGTVSLNHTVLLSAFFASEADPTHPVL